MHAMSRPGIGLNSTVDESEVCSFHCLEEGQRCHASLEMFLK